MLRILFLLSFVVVLTSPLYTFSQAAVSIDGQTVRSEGTINLERDDTIYLLAEGLKPKSKVYFKLKKAGIKLKTDHWNVDKEGNVKGIFDIPNMRVAVKALVSYFDADGLLHEVKVRLKIR